MSDLVQFLPPRRRAFRNILPGALIDSEIVSLAHVFAKGAVAFFVLGFVCRLMWGLL